MEERREGGRERYCCNIVLFGLLPVCLVSCNAKYLNINTIIISKSCISNLFGLLGSLRLFFLAFFLLLMITIQRIINADIRSIINTALATVALIMIVIDEGSSAFDCVFDSLTDDDVTDEISVIDDVVEVVGVVGVGGCIIELITEDIIPRERERQRGAWSILKGAKTFWKK